MADTMHLTRDQHGGYLLLILAYWRNHGPLPDDDMQLAATAKATTAEWRKLRPTLAQFFHIGDGVWRHKRIDAELAGIIEHLEKRAAAGKIGAQARWQSHTNGNGNRMPNALPTQWQNDAISPSEVVSKETTTPLRGVKARARARESASGEIFAKGLKLLGNKYRPLLAKMLKARGETIVAEALDAIDATNPDEPGPAFARLCDERRKPGKPAGPTGPPPTPAQLGWDEPP